MNTRTLGPNGISVSEIGLGCMSMSFGYGRPSPEKTWSSSSIRQSISA